MQTLVLTQLVQTSMSSAEAALLEHLTGSDLDRALALLKARLMGPTVPSRLCPWSRPHSMHSCRGSRWTRSRTCSE